MKQSTGLLTVLAIATACAGCAHLKWGPADSHPGMAALQREIEAGLDRRGVRGTFALYQEYSDGRLDGSAGTNTWSDKTGNCRLGWYDWLMRHQRQAAGEAERFTRELHGALQGNHRGLEQALTAAAEKLDVPTGKGRPPAPGNAALGTVRDAVAAARESWAAALTPLTEEEVSELHAHLYEVTTRQIEGSAAYFRDKATSRRMCDLLEAMNRQALYAAARALAPLTDVALLQSLARLEPSGAPSDDGILVSGKGDDVHNLDELSDVCVVVDTGGNDTYVEGTTSAARPVLIILDLAGDDVYRGTKPGIQGGAVLGVSMLVDLGGDDMYDAVDVAQGACLCGVGLLMDGGGDDTYRALRRAQGSALGGIAVHLDRAGDDSYHAALYAQGFGGPLGFGVLDDLRGNDHYYAGGKWRDGYDDTPGYDGWSQGVGAGPRGVANGGIGVLLDGAGDDVYECDYFSHGGGYWFAVGLARDFGGNDQRLGSTRMAYDGGERSEKVFLRWGIAWQAHFGLGFVFDDAGNDSYGGNIVGLGFSWDFGVAGLFDFAGDDAYLLTSGAHGKQAAFGMLFDSGGDDVYGGTGFGGAPAGISYHPLPQCGGNFAFAVNYGGHDRYGDEELNDVYLERGSPGGFLIDRDTAAAAGTR